MFNNYYSLFSHANKKPANGHADININGLHKKNTT
ncbi:hypothetical protein EVA_09125 [gut metagenome]|uniref:Uncharacterized protein n=1 Tax=gut metagenome TaxID=749906 RepID=J9GRJ5_9ZZZZ